MATRIATTGNDSLTLLLDGSLWDGGLTANLTITNTGLTSLVNWRLSFVSDVQINSTPWGLSVAVNRQADGHNRYTLTGLDWGASLASGGSVSVGFNAVRASDGSSGSLRAAALFVTSPVLTAAQPATTIAAPATGSNPSTVSSAAVTTASIPSAAATTSQITTLGHLEKSELTHM